MWWAAGPTGGGGGSSLTLLATLIGTGVALVTSIGTLLANLAAKRREDRAASAEAESVDVDRTRLGIEGVAAYADRLEKENTRLQDENRSLRVEVEELRDLRDVIRSKESP